MEITEVKVFPVNEEKLKAFVSIVFDRCFMINDIKIIQGRDGLFVSMPSRRKKSGEFKDVAHPLNNETRRLIETAIVGEYERVLAERGEELPAPPRPYPSEGPSEGTDSAEGDSAEGAAEGAAAPGGSAAGSPPPAAYGVPPRAAVPAAAGTAQAAAGDSVAARGQDGSDQDGSGPESGQDAAGRENEPLAAGDGDRGEGADKSLEEVQEIHLRDSFWSVS